MSTTSAVELDELEAGWRQSTADELREFNTSTAANPARQPEGGSNNGLLAEPQDKINRPLQQDSGYLDPTDQSWSQYLAVADKEDKALVESWTGEANTILIFTGLFAAVVATFAAQSYQLLSASSEDTSAAVLLQISQQISAISNGTTLSAASSPPFEAPAYAIRINALWFSSLFISLFCALLATLMYRWARRYLTDAGSGSFPHVRSRLHVLLSMGVHRFKLSGVIGAIVCLLHVAVALFLVGLLDLLFNLNAAVFTVTIFIAGAFLLTYLVLSFMPSFFPSAPFDTPLTPAICRIIPIFSKMLLWPLFYPIAGLGILLAKIYITFNTPMRVTRPAFTKLVPVAIALSHIARVFRQALMDYLPRLDRLRTSGKIEHTSEAAKYAAHQILNRIDEGRELEAFFAGLDSFLRAEQEFDRSALINFVFNARRTRDSLNGLLCHAAHPVVYGLRQSQPKHGSDDFISSHDF